MTFRVDGANFDEADLTDTAFKGCHLEGREFSECKSDRRASRGRRHA